MKRKCFLLLTFTALFLILCGVSDSKFLPDLATKKEEIRNQALDWLTSRRQENFGWGSDTARVIAAIAGAVDAWPSIEDLDARLSTKQLEIELLDRLLRNDTDPISPERLALYSLSLNAICLDSKDFHGYNLIDALSKHHADQDFPGYPEAFGYSLSSLVTCLGDAHLKKHQIRHLIQIFQDDTAEHTIDTRSVALMALECVQRHKHSKVLARHILEGLEGLAESQKPDGSFGNTHTTALVIQGFASSSYPTRFWNGTSALLFLISQQDKNGSFENDIHATTDVVLAMSALLNGSGLLGVKRNRCKYFEHHSPKTETKPWDSSTTTPKSTNGQIKTLIQQTNGSNIVNKTMLNDTTIEHATNPQMVTTSDLVTRVFEQTTADTISPFSSSSTTHRPDIVVKYWLWIGHDPITADKYNLTVHVPYNSTFFRLMLQAAQISEIYEFSSTLWPNGHYIHTIAGQREQPVGYHYWLLYRLPADPDQNNPPPTTYIAPGGVDDLIVHDGEIYLFWFKKI